MFIVPEMTNKKLGEESRILVLGQDLAILVEERVAPRLDIFLKLGVTLVPVSSSDLVKTSILPIGGWLVDQTVSAHGTRRQCQSRPCALIPKHHPVEILPGELDRLAVDVNLVRLSDGMLCSRLKSPHEAKISMKLMGSLTTKS